MAWPSPPGRGMPGLKLARKRAAESPKGELDHLLSYFHWWARTLAVLGLEAPRLPGASLRKVWSQERGICPTWELASDAEYQYPEIGNYYNHSHLTG